MWILFQTIEPLFWGVTAAGLDVEVAGGGGFGALKPLGKGTGSDKQGEGDVVWPGGKDLAEPMPASTLHL